MIDMFQPITQHLKPIVAVGRSKLADFLAGPGSREPQQVVVPDDLIVHASGAQYETATDQLDYLWFDLTEQSGEDTRRYVKVIRLVMLTYLPKPERDESNVLLEMQKALKAVCTARIDLVCLSLNMLEPDLGIVQIYGAAGTSPAPARTVARHGDAPSAAACAADQATAAQQAAEGLAVVVATLRAAYAQAIFKPLTREIGQWLEAAYRRMPFALVMRGQPDPRTNTRGPQSLDLLKPRPKQSELGLQQIEYVYRGMVAGQHEFVNVVMLSRAGDGPEDIYRLQERLATELSIWGSRIHSTDGFQIGLALPIALQAALGRGATTGYSAGEGHSLQSSQGAALGQAHSDSVAVSDVWGHATTRGESWSSAQTSGHSQSTTTSVSHSTNIADGTSHITGQAHSVADTHGSSSGTSTTHGTSAGSSEVASSGQNWSNGVTGGGSISAAPLGLGVSGKLDVSHSDGGSIGLADGVSSSVMDSATNIQMTSHAHTEANTTSVADGVSHSVGHGSAESSAQSVGSFESQTQAHGTSIAQSDSYAHGVSQGQGDTRSASVFGSSGAADSIGLARSQALAASTSSGLAVGLVPSLGFSHTQQAIAYNAKLIHDALARQFRLTETMALEGGVFVDSYFLVPTPEARAALKGLIAQAFHGTEEVATPVHLLDLAPNEDAYLRLHALTAVPSTMPERSPWALEGWRHTTLMTLLQAATCVAPGRFEHGAALTVWEPLPNLANVALNSRQGEALLGRLISPETGEVRRALVRLTERQLFPHWLIAADTRFGKTVLAQRLVYTMLQQQRCRIIVCDFAAGWRDLLALVGHDGRNTVEYGSLYPSAARPLHFNFLRVGPHIDAASTLAAIVDLTATAGRFGERQYGFLHQTLRDVYLENGVLTDDDDVLDDLVAMPDPPADGRSTSSVYQSPRPGRQLWGWLRPEEKDLINARRRARGEPELPPRAIRLRDLHADPLTARADRQAIAAQRSRRVDVRRWVARLTQLRDAFKRTPTSFDSIQGILNRLQLLAQGELGRMLGAGDDFLTVEELAWPQGLAVIEAGEGEALSAFAKSLLFSILVWRIYTDAVQRWAEARERGERVPQTVIVLEEANKIYAGVAAGSAVSSSSEPPRQSDLLPKAHRDAGKYAITFIDNLQSPHEIPLSIITSANNLALSKLKGDADAQVALAALGYSPHGLHDLALYHFLTGGIPQAQFVVKLGLHTDRTQTAPFLLHPLQLALAPVTDRDLLKQFSSQ